VQLVCRDRKILAVPDPRGDVLGQPGAFEFLQQPGKPALVIGDGLEQRLNNLVLLRVALAPDSRSDCLFSEFTE
jgi:hypothetical protein